MITVILSVFNEMNNPYLPKILAQFAQDSFFEVICIDGGSTDGTLDYLKRQNIILALLPHSTRAARLNHGIQQAKTDAVLLQHPRSLIAPDGLDEIKKNYQGLAWAGFTHQFDHTHVFLKFISWYSNHVRVQQKGIVYLDHCILINRMNIDLKAMPDLAVFEDTALSHALRKQVKPVLLNGTVMTSAIRFLDRGIYQHFLLNQWIKWLYFFKIDSRMINRIYEKKLNLNQEN